MPVRGSLVRISISHTGRPPHWRVQDSTPSEPARAIDTKTVARATVLVQHTRRDATGVDRVGLAAVPGGEDAVAEAAVEGPYEPAGGGTRPANCGSAPRLIRPTTAVAGPQVIHGPKDEARYRGTLTLPGGVTSSTCATSSASRRSGGGMASVTR